MGGDRREPRLCLKALALVVAMYGVDAFGHGNTRGICDFIGKSMHVGEPFG
jgi:hypothetical protein